MDKDYSFEALMDFLKYVADHGLWKSNTAMGYRSAASKVEGDLTEQEAADVRGIDLDLLFQRYMNRNKVKVSPGTLSAYKRRLRTAIAEFERYREDPINYRPKMGSARQTGDQDEGTAKKTRKAARRASSRESSESTPPVVSMPSSSTPMLTIPFPLRPDFLASVQIPRDLRKTEAERLAAFIRTLATDGGE